MKPITLLLSVAGLVAISLAAAGDAQAADLGARLIPGRSPLVACGPGGRGSVWNSAYYKPEWGMPVAVVVPPTAEYQTNYFWGAPSFHVSPLCPKYHRESPGAGVYQRGLFRPAPTYPSDTTQLGVYSVRGPW